MDAIWMKMALEEARNAFRKGEIPVGAVLVKDGTVIAKAHNLCEAQRDATAHAERLVISQASQTLGRWRLSDCTLYVTLEPCPMCMGAVINSRVGKVVFGAKDPRAGACGSLLALQNYPLEHTPVCVGGLLAEESLCLLRQFFEDKRRQNGKEESHDAG